MVLSELDARNRQRWPRFFRGGRANLGTGGRAKSCARIQTQLAGAREGERKRTSVEGLCFVRWVCDNLIHSDLQHSRPHSETRRCLRARSLAHRRRRTSSLSLSSLLTPPASRLSVPRHTVSGPLCSDQADLRRFEPSTHLAHDPLPTHSTRKSCASVPCPVSLPV